MAKLAFILLAHEAADVVADAADALLEGDDTCILAIHYDRKSPIRAFERLKERYRGSDRVFLVEERIACGWGEFGLVEATVNAMRVLQRHGGDYSHAYLVSSSCFPLKPLDMLRAFLDEHADLDFIESQDESWIKGGLRDERYSYYFPFSFSRRRGLFEFATALQRRLGIRRRRPDLTPRYGSQWWCLRRRTMDGVLGWIDANPAAFRFFRQVWIPDETFFQTIVPMVRGANPTGDWIPTLVNFNAFGKPVVLYDDHYDWLAQQPFFFARKIAPSAKLLRRNLSRSRTGEPHLGMPPSPSVAREPVPRLPVGKGYGRIFDPASGTRNWKRNLAAIRRPFVVLYGAPQLTALAREMLQSTPGLQVLGRVFAPAKAKLPGIRRETIPLRDHDRALYLADLLSRSAGLPVIELCPGDDPKLDRALLDGTSALVIPLVAGGQDDAWRELFSYLLLEADALPLKEQDADSGAGLLQLEIAASRRFGSGYFEVLKRSFLDRDHRPALVLSGGSAGLDERWRAEKRDLHGTAMDPFLDVLDDLIAAFADYDWRRIAPHLAATGEPRI